MSRWRILIAWGFLNQALFSLLCEAVPTGDGSGFFRSSVDFSSPQDDVSRSLKRHADDGPWGWQEVPQPSKKRQTGGQFAVLGPFEDVERPAQSRTFEVKEPPLSNAIYYSPSNLNLDFVDESRNFIEHETSPSGQASEQTTIYHSPSTLNLDFVDESRNFIKHEISTSGQSFKQTNDPFQGQEIPLGQYTPMTFAHPLNSERPADFQVTSLMRENRNRSPYSDGLEKNSATTPSKEPFRAGSAGSAESSHTVRRHSQEGSTAFCKKLNLAAQNLQTAEAADFDFFLQFCQPSQEFLRSALRFAVERWDRKMLLSILRQGTFPRETLVLGNVPLLHLAIDIGDFDMVSALLGAGADAEEIYFFTPLARAVKMCNVRLIQLLLDSGVKVDVRNAFGFDALQMSLACSNSSEIQNLLGDATEGLRPRIGETAPPPAPQQTSNQFPTESVEAFLDATLFSSSDRDLEHERIGVTGTNVGFGMQDPPSRNAAMSDMEAQLLLHARARDWKALNQQLESTNIDALSTKCWKDLMDAAVNGKQVVILRKLAVAPHTLKRSFGKVKRGLVSIAVDLGDYKLVEQAIRGGANVSRRDHGGTALKKAIRRGLVDIANLLVEAGART